MGDFNSLAPGDALQASRLLRSAVRKQRSRARMTNTAHSWRKFSRHLVSRAVGIIVNNNAGSFIVDKIAPTYARGGIDLLLQAGYVDCFRQANPSALGFTCPAIVPSGRIDFIFASPDLAARLASSRIMDSVPGIQPHEASDHLAVCAEFV